MTLYSPTFNVNTIDGKEIWNDFLRQNRGQIAREMQAHLRNMNIHRKA